MANAFTCPFYPLAESRFPKFSVFCHGGDKAKSVYSKYNRSKHLSKCSRNTCNTDLR